MGKGEEDKSFAHKINKSNLHFCVILKTTQRNDSAIITQRNDSAIIYNQNKRLTDDANNII